MNNQNEYDKHCKAIQLHQEGYGFNKILQLVQKSRRWLSKWLKRFKEQGLKGLRDKNRAPKQIWRKTPEHMVKKILTVRKELESYKTRRSAFSGIGAEVIQWELKQRKIYSIPAISTIEKILFHHGKTGRTKRRKNTNNQPYPYIKAEKIGDLHQTNIVGPRHLRGSKGVTRFYSFHTVDVAGHTAFTSQFSDKQTISLCRHLIETWRFMGIPEVSQMDNEMSATGGGRYPYSISQFIRLHLLLGIHLVFIPQEEPGRNASVESFNALWQERVLRRHNCPTLIALKRTSERFLRYYNSQWFQKSPKGRRIIPMRSLSKKSKKVIEKSMKEFVQRNSLVELTKVGARMMIQIALEEELRAFLGRDYYDRRSAGQEGSRAGSKPRTIKIGCGDIEIEMPKVKDTGGPFHSERYYMIGR